MIKGYAKAIGALLLLAVIVGALLFEYNYLRIETDVVTKLVIIFLFNFTVISLLILFFFVSKNLLKLWIEQRKRVAGLGFRTRIVAIFVGLTLLPSVLLFIIASGIVTSYIDRWFDPQVKEPLEDSLALAKAFYENERERTINKARGVIRGEVLRENITVHILKELPENASETVINAFKGREGTEVITREDGDIIRAVIPEVIQGEVKRVFIAESIVPAGIVSKIDKIRQAQERYFTLTKLKTPLKINYLIILTFFSALIVFMALWVSLRISRGITEPIEVLAHATEDIASGNLDIGIDIDRSDEIGTLVSSFNKMVHELKENKHSLEYAYFDSNRRRVCMENILENIDSGVISLDNEGKVLTINSSACSILGIDPSMIFEHDVDYRFLLSYVDSEEFRHFIETINLKDLKTAKEQMTVHIRGQKLLIRILITRLQLPDGQPIGVLVVFDDLTDVIRAQQALTWQEVARRIAHEIKNPLTPIRLSAERLLRKWENRAPDLDLTVKKSTNAIIKEVEGLRKLVDEFSRFGKMPEIRKEQIDFVNFIHEVIDLYKNHKGVHIRVHAPGNLPLVGIDPHEFKRVLINLFENAINAMDGNGSLDVNLKEMEERDNLLVMEISDTGTGINDKDKDKLFLPYFSTKRDGTGLGLAISHRIISEHGGTISVADNVPRGATFIIKLPV